MSWKTKLVGFAKRAGNHLKAKSPTILVVTGVAGLVVAGVIACKETHDELDNIIADHKEKVQAIKDIRDGVVVLDEYTTEEYAETKYKKHLFHIYMATTWKIVKTYAPAFLLAAVSIFAILWGHKIISKRHLAAVAECYAWKEALEDYRKRVAGKIGDEAEKALYHNEEVEIVTDKLKDADGKDIDKTHESKKGYPAKLPYTYIISRDTMKPDWWFDDDEEEMRTKINVMLGHVANQYMEVYDEMKIFDIMKTAWRSDYLEKCPEIRNGGWWKKNPYAPPLDSVHPIDIEVRRLSEPGQPLIMSATFNAQGDIVAAMEMARNEQKELKRRHKPRGKVKPAYA